MNTDPYAVLGVPRSASDDDIKQSYRKLAREHHPDRSGEPDATEKFQAIAKAYEVIGDPAKRAMFDQFGDFTDHGVDEEIAYLMIRAIDAADGNASINVVDVVRLQLEEAVRSAYTKINNTDVKRRKRERMIRRLRRRSGPNVLADLLQRELDVLSREIEGTKFIVERSGMLLEALRDYEFEVERPTVASPFAFRG